MNEPRPMPEFLAKKYSLSDPALDTTITEFFNKGYWIETLLSNHDHLLIIFAREKQAHTEEWTN